MTIPSLGHSKVNHSMIVKVNMFMSCLKMLDLTSVGDTNHQDR